MSAEIDSFLLDQIKRHEGFEKFPYECPAGKLTIGYGRNIEEVGITENEAEFLLLSDVQRSAAELNKNFEWYYNLTKRRKQAMINLLFNLGLAKLREFKKFLAAMESGDYPTASKELLDSKYARQVGKRADELAHQLVNG